MSQSYDNEKKFALFVNDKGGNEKRPDYRGEITINGVSYRLSGWKAEIKSGPKAGQKYLRGSAEIDEKKNPIAPPAAAPAVSNGADADVPF